MPPANRFRLDRPGVLHPTALVDVVDVEVGEQPAGCPEERVEVLDLVERLGEFPVVGRDEALGHGPVHAVAA